MTFRPQGRPRALRVPRRPRYLIPAVAVIVAVVVLFMVFAGIWTDYLWYRSVHFTSIFTTTLLVKLVLFVAGATAMAGLVGGNMYLARRLRPAHRPASQEQQGLDRYRAVIEPHRRIALGAILGLIALITGLSVAGYWRTWLLFADRTSFGRTDPQFHFDISFYTFTYPFIRFVLGFAFTAVLLSVIATVAVHYLYGGVRLQGPGERATAAARAHLFVLLGVFVLLKAVAYYFDRYGLNFSERGAVTTGASYTDVNAVLPAKTILAVIAVVCALLFFAGAARRSVIVPAVGFGLLVLSAIIVGGVYPAIIQQFQVKPNELAKETPYIQREISGTRTAYGVTSGNVHETSYPAALTEPVAQLGTQVTSLPATRLADPGVLSPAFQQLQQIKGYYKFPGSLDIDRYPVSGSNIPQDMVVAARELPGPPTGQSNWITQHLVYTHGYGFVAASADSVASDGGPSFTESDIPQRGHIPVTQPRVYFGQNEANYAIVGAPRGRAPMELDYPNQSASEQQNYTYQGDGGVPIGPFFNQLLYAAKFRQLNILLSGSVNDRSRIMYIRDPLSRVAKVAPFLTLDGDPYPVTVGGRIEWVVDGYTSSDNYPYSERSSMSGDTADSGGATPVEQSSDQINYLRNSVKAVVDAYTGSVTLYQWDSADPVLRTWMKAFPGVIKPHSDIPGTLMAHLRYPQDEFKVQRHILARYHVTQAGAFYGGQGFWDVPADPTNSASGPQPPYYLTMNMPGSTSPQYSLTTPYVFKGRQNLAAYMAVDSNPQSPGYGQIQVLELPSDTAIPGPQQVQNAFESDPSASYYLSQYRQGGSRVILGNLITLPVGGALLYIEPIYLQASASSGGGSYPTLQRVFVSFNGSTGYAPSLQQALSQVISTVPSQPSQPGQPATGPAPPSGRSQQLNAAVQADLAQAQQYYKAAQAALRNGDLATYSQDIQKMNSAVQAASAAASSSSASPASSGAGR